MTVADASWMAKGTILQVGAGAKAQTVRVRAIAGTGPFTVDVSPLTRWERLRMWAASYWRRMARPLQRRVRRWQMSRCDGPGCWRTGVIEERAFEVYCPRHAWLAFEGASDDLREADDDE